MSFNTARKMLGLARGLDPTYAAAPVGWVEGDPDPGAPRPNSHDVTRHRLWRAAFAGFVFAAFSLVATLGPVRAEDTPPPAATADALWSASFKDLTGTVQSLGQYKGKTAVVYFWATWCEPCQKEGPALQALYDKFKDKNFTVVGIALDNADKVKEFAAKHGMAFPIVYGGREAIELGKTLGNSLGGIPFVVVIDRDGKIVQRITGESPDGKVEDIVAPLLAG